MPTRLDPSERTAGLASLPQWKLADGREAIERTFTFANFNQAFGFMTRCALLAEKMDHHPEWFNVYNRVEVLLATHDVDGLSELDLRLARAMDRISSQVAEAADGE